METWKRNLYVIWVAELVPISCFSVMYPFLPYYIQELGVTELHQVELWSRVLFAGHAVGMAITAPIWGLLADRYGCKLMVERAMFGGAIIVAAMGFAQNAGQLVILYAIQGAFSGTALAATMLVASSSPREQAGYAMGVLQAAIWTGSSVGPLLGGPVADTWGYRATFWVTGALLLLAGLTVWRFVHEDFTPPSRDEGDPDGGFWDGIKLVARNPAIVRLFSVRVTVRIAIRMMGPVLPLFVQSLVPTTTRIASLMGLISGVGAASSAVGGVTLGRAGDRLGYRRVLLVCIVGATVLYVPQFFVTTPWQLLVLQGAGGLVMSGVVTSISALLARLAPEGRQGAVYGVDASVVSMANAVGPMLGASVAAGLGLRVPFLLTAGVLAVAAGLVWALLPRPERQESPAPSE